MNGNKIYLEAPVIINTVADYFKLPLENVICINRKREFIKAKHIAMYCCRKFTDMSFNKISEWFNKDHATIIYAIHSVENQDEIYKAYHNELNQILKKLNMMANDDLEFSEDYRNYETDNT